MSRAAAPGAETNQCPRCKLRYRSDVTHCLMDGEALVRIEDRWLGRSIAGRYLVEEKIGDGGMGSVYRGRHQVIDREVAIKFLHPRHTQDPKSRQRFLGEARAANQINHENIIDITDFGETDDGHVYLVMEYLQGRTLAQEIANGPLPLPRALHIAAQTAAGLARAHELDVFHRDVKPGNVFLIKRHNDRDFVKLLDFGVARFARESRITDHGVLMGTPEYMAPEQMRAGAVGPTTDLYALGCVLFEMLTGRPPFTGNMSEVLVKHLQLLPPAPSSITPGLPPELDALLAKMLAKEPADRHRDAFHVKDDLLALLERSAPSAPPAAASPSKPAAPRSMPADRPTLHIPSEGADWRERVQLYREQLTRRYPAGNAPAAIAAAMQRMEETLMKIMRLRGEMDGSARELTNKEDDLRATRLRIGHALDELAHDESKLGRQLEAEQAELRAAQHAAQGCIEAVLSRPSLATIAAKQDQPLSQEDAISLQGFVVAVEGVRTSQARLRKLEPSQEAKREALKDLAFQIAQLKNRLAMLNVESGASQGETQERVLSADTEIRLAMAQVVTDAETIALHLNT
ncbi:MAG TPA: serine/threonine-protein kinase [Polyangiales bacterium]|nr:serine/threonine-protein kinase [Polyangiales bacterium]